jgi:hypothetical protein
MLVNSCNSRSKLLVLLICGCLILSSCSMERSSRSDETSTQPYKSPEALPQFPFPPNASLSYDIDKKWLGNLNKKTTFLEIGNRLQLAFKRAGYVNTGYYQVPGGFVLVSSLEQFESNGRPTAAQYRWTTTVVPTTFDLYDILQVLSILFKGRTGRFRVIGFMVIDQSFEKGGTSEFESIKKISEGGLNRMPEEFGQQIFTDKHYCVALIYEFEKKETQAPVFLRNGSITPEQHLQPLLNELKK